MPTRTELQELAQTRLEEAKSLFSSEFYEGAFYLAGYVIELALKARICKILEVDVYPETGKISSAYKTHVLDDLLLLAGLQRQFEQDKLHNSRLAANWSLITGNWNETVRYRPVGYRTLQGTQEMISAIENTEHGIFTWVKTKW